MKILVALILTGLLNAQSIVTPIVYSLTPIGWASPNHMALEQIMEPTGTSTDRYQVTGTYTDSAGVQHPFSKTCTRDTQDRNGYTTTFCVVAGGDVAKLTALVEFLAPTQAGIQTN